MGGGAVELLHTEEKAGLLLLRQIGQLHGWTEGHFPFVHHRKQRGYQVGQPDVAVDLIAAVAALLGQFFIGIEPFPQWGKSVVTAVALAIQGLQLHLVGKGFFAGQDVLSLQIGIHHGHHCLLVGHFPDNHRHGCKAQPLTGSQPPMA